jgi:hypothetical protein
MVFQNDILAGAAGAGVSYQIDQSIRFDSADSAYLTRTPSLTGDQKKWTTSFWFKRCKTGATDYLMTAGQTSTNDGVTAIYINSTDDTIHTYFDTTGASPAGSVNARKFRDPSAWYHFIWAVDAVNTVQRIWVNGEELSLDAGKNPPNFAYDMNASGGGKRMSFGAQAWGPVTFANIYAAEIHHLDGQYITDPTTFGEYDDNGVWRPIEVTGLTYGTNGFYITGEDSADLGADYSGNANDFTSSGLTSDDQVVDTPTDNYATLNPLDDATGFTTPLISNGNLDVDDRTGNAVRGNFGFKQGDGKYVYEVNITNLIGSMDLGWSAAGVDLWAVNGAEVMYEEDGNKLVSANSSSTPTRSAYGASYTSGDVIRVETDFDGSVIEFFKNGTSQGTIDFSGMNDGTLYFPACYCNRVDAEFNFGQQPFIGTPTAGYKALSTANLPTPAIKDGSKYFQTTLYTGDGNATQTITQSENSTFNPDLVWIKNRSNAYAHNVNDAVRGYTGASPATAADVKVLASDATDREGLGDTLTTAIQRGFVQASTANGFIVNKGTAGSQDGFYTNASGYTYAAWQWLAANGTASNTNGSITSTVSANTTAGFSIVGYTGITGGGTIGHGLSDVPDFIVVKHRPGTDRWTVFHTDTSDAYIYLNETLAAETANAALRFGNGTVVVQPTSSVFTIGTSTDVNTNGNDYIAYCWHSVEGFSKFGKYTGNGSADGPFVWCDFRPAYVLIKVSSTSGSWFVYDTARDTYNASKLQLFPNLTSAEDTSSTYDIDIVSNGFKIRSSNGNINTSSGTHIFMAFAEVPFGGAGVAPVPAR